MMKIIPGLVLAIALVGLLGGCNDDDPCDCAPGLSCEGGQCRCDSDEVCGEGMVCSVDRLCKPEPPCRGNQDCADGEMCNSADPSGGKCIPATVDNEPACGASVHCEFGEYCDQSTGLCQEGCEITGDCQLGYVCAASQCVLGGTSTDCERCPTDPFVQGSYCDYLEICSPDGNCVANTAQPTMCDACDPVAPPGACGEGMICLATSETEGSCVSLCASEADCAGGFTCRQLQSVPGWMGANPCSDDPQDTTCDDLSGTGRTCIVPPENPGNGLCECLSDDECNTNLINLCQGNECTNTGQPCGADLHCACDTSTGYCANSQQDCTVNEDCFNTCVDVPFGARTVGQCQTPVAACVPIAGEDCASLAVGTSECRAP